MSDEIPSAVSAADLAAVLSKRGKLPPASALPSLQFGDDDCGGPCDLQLAVMLLIDRSDSGVNLVQEATCALWLLHRIQEQIESHHNQATAGEGIFDSLSGEPLERVRGELGAMRNLIGEINSSLMVLHSGMTIPAVERRCRAAMAASTTELSDEQLSALRSQLLISDEVIESLGLERKVVDQFLEHQIGMDPGCSST